ncbi:16S rRNA methyltransferase [Brachybacterium endophyticum]|uniref:16S rRNA methyltransferase n=1 Tax=Brachybacterium endophyticum TaxID=2182385 RepID=A0A2U2RMN8_9MICO|nr:methyltransferase [Brachybacterium endophyticum]PWH07055.1 16S rRNA methyltransferase [Brachybacterium endophyticum]
MSEHYFSPVSATDDARLPLQVELDGSTRDLVTSKAVFSARGLDKATAVLLHRLDVLPAVPTGGRLLDLGCGWGPIALTAALRHPDAEVWAVDVSERARDITRENAARLGVTVHVAAPEEVPDGLAFEAIWSNPPIRIGKQALHELLEHWCARLAPQGTASLVVGKNLGADPLATWLDSRLPGREVRKLASAKGFRILGVGPETASNPSA